MDFGRKTLFLSTLLVAFAGQAYCDITQEPKDETVELGKDITLQCVSDNAGDLIEWRSDQYDDGNSPIFSTENGIADPTKYEREGTGANFNLIVKSTVWNDGGEYRCSKFGGASYAAQLVVLGEPFSTLFTLIEGQMTEAMCQVQYSASLEAILEGQHLPQMKAYIDGNQQTPTSYGRIEAGPGDSSNLKLTLNYTANSAHHGKNWTCEAYTEAPHLVLISDNEMEVQFPVRDMDIVPKNAEFMVGEFINCTVQGHPAPQMSWIASQSGGARPVNCDESTTCQLEITQDMMEFNRWECQAINTAPGSADPIKLEIEFTVVPGTPGGDDGESSGGGDSSGGGGSNDATAIAVGVVVPIVIIAIIAVVIFLLWKRRNQKGSDSSKKPPQPTGYDQESGVNPSVDMRPNPGMTPTNQNVPQGYHAYTGPGAPPVHAGKDSPGYGDLGIKHMNGNPQNISFDDSFVDEKPTQPPSGPAYSNEMYNPSPKGSTHSLSGAGDGGTAV